MGKKLFILTYFYQLHILYHLHIFLICVSVIMFCFDLFYPCNKLEVLWLEMFDFRAAEINNEHIEAAIL